MCKKNLLLRSSSGLLNWRLGGRGRINNTASIVTTNINNKKKKKLKNPVTNLEWKTAADFAGLHRIEPEPVAVSRSKTAGRHRLTHDTAGDWSAAPPRLFLAARSFYF